MISAIIDLCLHTSEVYNYKELRSELKAKGYHFKSQTDSEVVLSALVEWRSTHSKLNGMFALALGTEGKNALLARDRYGIKPLYYFQVIKFSLVQNKSDICRTILRSKNQTSFA